ncbi:hypothetical protein [Streptomyces iconiensis]|uniref:Uncharacterized protein n=1 Tax=Streptomyces iconiensis TaxID=1384038 RepID=A0ABT7A9M4_9ACTN|nr:hypothetical protein [Streptomyces iconiensis]MDJ1138038.1 hypothetical protein [Streptomyces iconiensis]
MGSLRNPIGPLPSSIYWRRRAVALAVLALMVLVLVWVLVSGDGGGSRDEGKSGDGNGPASTITPGPTDSGPAISERPGGRDEEDGGGSGGSGGSAGSGSDEEDEQSTAGGTGWGAGSASGGTASGSGSGTGSGADAAAGGSGGGGKAAVPVPAAPGLADCEKSDVKLSLRSLKKKYGPGEKPRFELKADNGRGSACKIDLGRTATIVTINNPDDAKFWASDDCPPTKKAMLRQVPANGASTHTLTWFRKASAANCGTPTFDAPRSGTYEVEVKVKGFKAVKATFDLEK